MKVSQNKDFTLIAPDIYPLMNEYHSVWPEGVEPISDVFPVTLLLDDRYKGLVKCGWPQNSKFKAAYRTWLDTTPQHLRDSQLNRKMKYYIADKSVFPKIRAGRFPAHVFDNDGYFFMKFYDPVIAQSDQVMQGAKFRMRTEALK